MGTKNIFQRWKSGWLGCKTADTEIQVVCESSEKFKGRAIEAPLLWVDGIRKEQIKQYGPHWIPFDKYCYIHGYAPAVAEDQADVWRRLHMPEPHEYPDNSVNARLTRMDDFLPDRPPTYSDTQAALAFYDELNKSITTPVWDQLYLYLDQDKRFFNVVDYYLKSQYDICDSYSEKHVPKKWLALWYIAGKPRRKNSHGYDAMAPHYARVTRYREHYADAIDKIVQVIVDWCTLSTGVSFPPKSPCCDFPQELTPGVMALYDHHCRFKEEDTAVTEKYITIHVHRTGELNAIVSRWYVRTDKGDFPVKLGGYPDELDVFVKPFYRFTNDRPEGENTCSLHMASGTKGLSWQFTLDENYEIVNIHDQNGHEMEAITIPIGSAAIGLFKIDCPLRELV